jgi:uncharacterized YigZ family protein
MSDTYLTIQSSTEGLFKDKGSKFISFAIPVTNTDEIKEILKEYRKRFFDARHVCYAYILGHERNEFRANDDGEPSGTAGRPILGQINSRELTNVLVIVVRYFGGILLGTSGLINAYKEAAAEALNEAKIVEKIILQKLTFEFEYIRMNEVMRVIKETGATVNGQDYDSNCIMTVSIRQQDFDRLREKLVFIRCVIPDNESD